MPRESSEVVIGPAQPADGVAIEALLKAADLPHEDFAQHLAHFIIARSGGVVVGAVGYERHGDDALLRSLVVEPSCRGTGLGDALVRRLAEAAVVAGVRQFYLLTTTAEGFFAQRGFRVIARDLVPPAIAATEEFRRLCPASAVCLTRPVRR